MESTCKEIKISIYDVLIDRLEAKVRPLRDRQEGIKKRLFELSEKKQETVLDAQMIVLTRNVEEATAIGDENQTKNLLTELATIEAELEDLISTKKKERATLLAEFKEIESEIETTANTIGREAFSDIRQKFAEEMNKALDVIQERKKGFEQFCSENRVPLEGNYKQFFKPHPSDMFGEDLKRLYQRFQIFGWL